MFTDTSIYKRNRRQSGPSIISENSTTPSILLEIAPDAEYKHITDRHVDDEKTLQTKFEDQINWVTKDQDFVSMETLKSLDEFEILLEVVHKCGYPIALTVRQNNDRTYTVLYQFVETFRQEFMMLRVGGTHCLFLNPF